MPLQIEKVPSRAIAELRGLHRAEAKCQIVRDSILPRGLADPFLLTNGSEPLGYAGVWNQHFPGRLMEFFVVEGHRGQAAAHFVAFLKVAEVTAVEAQTNMPLLHGLLLKHVPAPAVENLLFGDGPDIAMNRPELQVRPRLPGDQGPEGEWVVQCRGEVVGAGGYLTHYNPPYADLYMDVRPDARGQGVGSFLVQELRRICREAGRIPAARCDPGNEASRRTLLRGGMRKVGEIVAGSVTHSTVDRR